jgi:uncharacterized membrane protein
MNMRVGWIMTLSVIAAMVAASAYALAVLPPDTRIAIHFGGDGQPDGWSPAWFGVFIMPAASLVTSAVFAILPVIDPRRRGIERSIPALVAVWMAALACFAVAHAAILLEAVGEPIAIGSLLTGAAGVLLLVMGNFMGKIRWNYTFGIRTPWTLADERVWDKTHRFGGKLFFALGAVLIVAAFLPVDVMIHGRLFYLLLPATVLIVLKSYWLWRQERRAL